MCLFCEGKIESAIPGHKGVFRVIGQVMATPADMFKEQPFINAQAVTSQPVPHNSSNIINNNGTKSFTSNVELSTNTNNAVNKNSLSSTIHKSRTNKNNTLQDPRSPKVILIPTSAQPTDVLAARFTAWRQVIRSIIIYLSETASIQDEILRQQLRLTNSIQFSFFSVENQYQPSSTEDRGNQQFFSPLGNGSIQDLPTILVQYHTTMASYASRSSKELSNDVIPRLEDLRRDLLVKIKEIKSLQSDFKNSCNKELASTKQCLSRFQESVDESQYSNSKLDPYLAKIVLDRQIRRQLNEENFLHEAFNNLQNSGRELERVVVMELQNAMTIYAKLLGKEAQLTFDALISKLDTGFFNKELNFEWDNFISKNSSTFVLPNIPMRKMSDIVYKHQNNPINLQIRSGYLERRSKFLKTYSQGFYVLTGNYLHEFKTGDRKKDLVPLMSIPLNELTVTEHSKKGRTDYKFIIHAKSNGLISRGQNWVLKTDSYENMINWFNDIKQITSFNNNYQPKIKYIQERLQISDLDSSALTLTKQQQSQRRLSLVNNRDSTIITTSMNDDSVSSFPLLTPKLDQQTNTVTTISSIPDTDDLQLHATLPPNIYIHDTEGINK